MVIQQDNSYFPMVTALFDRMDVESQMNISLDLNEYLEHSNGQFMNQL